MTKEKMPEFETPVEGEKGTKIEGGVTEMIDAVGDFPAEDIRFVLQRVQSVVPVKPKDCFSQWFDDCISARYQSMYSLCSGKVVVPDDIVAMPCGCERVENDAAVWTIEPEPLEQTATFRTSQVMKHSSCQKTIGEIPTSWLTL